MAVMEGPTAAAGADSFLWLQRLAASFAERGPRRPSAERTLVRLARGLGATAVPLCLRHLGGDEASGRWAFRLLLELAGGGAGADDGVRRRVLRGLAAMIDDVRSPDDGKLRALALRAELGDRAPAVTRLADPAAAQARSLQQISDCLGNRAEVACAAAMLVEQLDELALLELVDALAIAEPARAARLIDELLVRSDVDERVRSELRRMRVAGEDSGGPRHADAVAPDTVHAAAGTDPAQGDAGQLEVRLARRADGRQIVVAIRRIGGSRPVRVRTLCAFIDEGGYLADALHEVDLAQPTIEREVLAPLRREGFRFRASAVGPARALLIAAARRARARGHVLPRAFYLGRDLLGVFAEHLPTSSGLPDGSVTALLGRGIDLLAAGDAARARPLLERYAAACPDDAEGASSLGLCLLALAEPVAARPALVRAAALEPERALHRWNLAAAAHREGRLGGCYLALIDYLGAIDLGPEHGAVARRFVADYERVARLEWPGIDAAAVARADDDLGHARELLRAGRGREAVGILRGALDAAPTHPALWVGLGQAYLVCRRPDEARRAGLQALALAPDDEAAHAVVAEATAAHAALVVPPPPRARRTRPRRDQGAGAAGGLGAKL